MRLAIIAYILPFFFVFNQGYLLDGSVFEIFNLVVAALAGIMLLSVGLAGYFIRHLSWTMRLVMLAGGLASMIWGVSSWPGALASWILLILFYVTLKKQVLATS